MKVVEKWREEKSYVVQIGQVHALLSSMLSIFNNLLFEIGQISSLFSGQTRGGKLLYPVIRHLLHIRAHSFTLLRGRYYFHRN